MPYAANLEKTRASHGGRHRRRGEGGLLPVDDEHADFDARAVAHHGGGQARQMARQGRRCREGR